MNWNITAGRPVYVQLVEQLELALVAGEFPPGSRIPPVRELAADAGVNPNTMQRALAQLEAEGLSFGILAILMMAEIDLLDQLPWMLSQLREAFARYDMAFWEMMLFSGLVCFVRMVSAIACIYAACMVGHQFKSHPALAGILSFFGMQYVQGWIEKLLRVGARVYETALYTVVGDAGSIQTTLSAQGFMGCAALTLGIAAAFGVFWFGLTVWLMRNRLNME